jgi:hypothetical protein
VRVIQLPVTIFHNDEVRSVAHAVPLATP